MQRSDLASELRRDRAGVTTASQERELRDIAARMGCQIVETYRDHGISGAKGMRSARAYTACRLPISVIQLGYSFGNNSDFAAVSPTGTGAIPRFSFGNHGPTEPGYPETGTVCLIFRRYKSTFTASRRLASRMTFGCCASLLSCSLFGW